MSSNSMKISSLIETTSTVLDNSTGEVIQSTDTVKQSFRVPKEPAFVKLYLDCLSRFKDIQVSLNPILIELLRMATYSSCDEHFGGQIIQLTKVGKQIIATRCDVSVNRVEHALTEFVKKEYLYRIGQGTYQVNANLFGKGDWSDISNLRNIQAKIDFASGVIETEFIRDKVISYQEAKELTSHLPYELGDPQYDEDEGVQLAFGADDNEQ
ncbi:MAG: hypothetical protein J6S67_26285 [Methanobrevibacter sp.]|nr:hypothetical protein [Methanobrevibacter sp.]